MAKKKAKKKVLKKKSKPIEKKDIFPDRVVPESIFTDLKDKLHEAVECLKRYTKKDQIGELANPAIELLTKWEVTF